VTLRERALRGQSLADLRIVDVHTHPGPYADFVIPDPGPDGMLRTMDHCGIEVSVIAPIIAMGPDESEANRQSFALAGRFPDRFLPYCCINPNRAERHVCAELECYVASGRAAGIKLHPSLHRSHVASDRYAPAFEYAGRAGIPVLIHVWEGCPYCSPQALGELARHMPHVKLIMGHTGGFPEDYYLSARAAFDAPNVWFDLTGSRSRVGAIERLVSEVGSRRVVFGSDLPFLDPRPKIGQVLFAALPDDSKRAILSGNARELFGLPAARS
jgi:uncharacterized protein